MSKRADYRCLERIIVPKTMIPLSELQLIQKIDKGPDNNFTDEDTLSSAIVAKVRYRRYCISGVPIGQIDLLMPESVPLNDMIWIELGEKTGRFDGKVRDRITFRNFPPSVLDKPVEISSFTLARKGNFITLVAKRLKSVIFEKTYTTLRNTLEPGDYTGIVLYHYRNYFTHLREHFDDVMSLAVSWKPSLNADLNSANREASRVLYDLSRSYGFRKLTIRERERYNIPESRQWVKDTVLIALLKKKRANTAFNASLSPYAYEESVWKK